MSDALNMCMFTSKVDYDAAVRKRWEEKNQPLSSFEISQQNLRKALTDRKKICTMSFSVKQGAK
jgi:hypothetical protein